MFIFSACLIVGGGYIFIKAPQEQLNLNSDVKIENQSASMQINENSLASPSKR